MGCIAFCCCCMNFTPKVFACIALGCNIFKLVLAFISLFAIIWAILLGATLLSFVELGFTITNLVHAAVILCKLSNKEAFGEFNSCAKCMCITSMVFSGIMIIFRIIILIIIIAAATEVGGGVWAGFIITFILFLAVEVINFLAFYYLYKLLELKADCSYNDYIQKKPSEQISVTVNNINNNQNNLFPSGMQNNMSPPVANNMVIQTPPTNNSMV